MLSQKNPIFIAFKLPNYFQVIKGTNTMLYVRRVISASQLVTVAAMALLMLKKSDSVWLVPAMEWLATFLSASFITTFYFDIARECVFTIVREQICYISRNFI